MNNEKLRSDWEALTEQEKEEVIEALKQAFDAMKHATIVLTETVIKVMPELLKPDTNDLVGLSDNEEGVLQCLNRQAWFCGMRNKQCRLMKCPMGWNTPIR